MINSDVNLIAELVQGRFGGVLQFWGAQPQEGWLVARSQEIKFDRHGFVKSLNRLNG